LDFYLSSTFAAVLLVSGRFVRVLSSISECFAGRNLGISPEFRENQQIKFLRKLSCQKKLEGEILNGVEIGFLLVFSDFFNFCIGFEGKFIETLI
jgi:hypothetical protein